MKKRRSAVLMGHKDRSVMWSCFHSGASQPLEDMAKTVMDATIPWSALIFAGAQG